MCKFVMLSWHIWCFLRVKTFEKDFICWCFSLCDPPPPLHTLPPTLLAHHHSFQILLYFHLVSANQILSLSSAAQTKQCSDVRSQFCTMTPFQGATVVTLRTITALSSLRGVITESDAPAEFAEIRGGGDGGVLQFYCLLRKVGKQKMSIKQGCGTNDVRAAVSGCLTNAALGSSSLSNAGNVV